jgi:hypothetical protein
MSAGGGDPTADMAPGDEAPKGTPGAGENLCPACAGSGQLDGAACQTSAPAWSSRRWAAPS